MAKAQRGSPPRRVAVAPSAGAERVGYLKGVIDELRKVIWPAPGELWRMTGIVVATVVIFSALIGGTDYGLSLAVRQLYTSTATTTATPAPVVTTPAAVPSSAGLPSTQPSTN